LPRSEPDFDPDAESEPRMPDDSPIDPVNLVAISEKLRVISDPTRLRILSLLCARGAMHVAAIGEAVGKAQPHTSHHLRLLKVAGLVTPRRVGHFVRYSITPGWGADLLADLAPLVGVAKLHLK
jgi:DNA-binding transcriptional ArsR family regulator